MIPQFNPLSSFYPLSLFANGEPGFWLDPSDLSTMYQDSAGTTPVTAVEQPVGLILDKSQGLVLGAELVTNGNPFVGTTGWASGSYYTSTATVVAGELRVTSTVAFGSQVYAFTTVVGKTYFVTANARVISGGGSAFALQTDALGSSIGTSSLGVASSTATPVSYYFIASATTSYIALRLTANGAVGGFGAISCKSIAGTHYYQSTAGVRPVLSARVNLLTKTEDLTVSPWALNANTVSGTKVLAPDGTLTAQKVIPSTSNVAHAVDQSFSGTGIFTQVFYVRGDGYNYVSISNSPNNYVHFDLTNGNVSTLGTGWGSATCVAQGGGWYKITFANSASQSWVRTSFYIGNAWVSNGNSGPADTFAGDGTSGVDVWHPDLRPSDQATGLIPTYQRVNTSTDYDTAGFPLYLSGNGTQWMQCAAQDYTGVNKMLVCAGVRKLSNTGANVAFELSASIDVNNGAVFLGAPNGSNRYQWQTKGTTSANALTTSATYDAPISNVVTGLGDISAPVSRLRLNGSDIQTTTTTQGTGNYGNYAAYLFSRAGASLFLTGNIYQLIARGSTVASSAAQIAATENWTDLKTKAY